MPEFHTHIAAPCLLLLPAVEARESAASDESGAGAFGNAAILLTAPHLAIACLRQTLAGGRSTRPTTGASRWRSLPGLVKLPS